MAGKLAGAECVANDMCATEGDGANDAKDDGVGRFAGDALNGDGGGGGHDGSSVSKMADVWLWKQRLRAEPE